MKKRRKDCDCGHTLATYYDGGFCSLRNAAKKRRQTKKQLVLPVVLPGGTILQRTRGAPLDRHPSVVVSEHMVRRIVPGPVVRHRIDPGRQSFRTHAGTDLLDVLPESVLKDLYLNKVCV